MDLFSALKAQHHVRSGKNLNYDCPFCGEDRGRFGLCVAGEKRGQYHCFNCDKSGRLKRWKELAGGRAESGVERGPYKSGALLPDFRPFSDCGCGRPEYSYAVRRGVPAATALDWGIASRTHPGRLIIPVMEKHGTLMTYTARAIKDGVKPKELAPYNRSDHVYGLSHLDSCRQFVIVTEGVFDAEHVMKVCGEGFPAVALMGSHATQAQIKKLKDKNFGKIVVLFDGDPDGRKKAKKVAAKLCDAAFYYASAANVPEDKDPDELTGNHLIRIIRSAL